MTQNTYLGIFILLLNLFSYSVNASQKNVGLERKIDPMNHSNSGLFYEDDIVEGDPNSKVIVIEYYAPTCPHCSTFHKTVYPKLKEKYIDTNKIAFIQREFVGNKQDFMAATLGRCVAKDKRKAMIGVLLSQQENWAYNRNFAQILTNIGQMAGLSPEKFNACMENEDIGTALMSNSKLISRTPGFIGTPVFVINDKVHKGNFTLDTLSKVIDNQIAKGE